MKKQPCLSALKEFMEILLYQDVQTMRLNLRIVYMDMALIVKIVQTKQRKPTDVTKWKISQ